MSPDETLYRYIALIRAINVGGRSVTKMTDIQKVFESLDLKDVLTYSQSGNVIFSSKEANSDQLGIVLEKKLFNLAGRPISVFILKPGDLRQASDNNPFHPEKYNGEQSCYIMFLSAEPDPARIAGLMETRETEYRFHVQNRFLYYAYPRTYAGHRRMIDFERELGVCGTARSWKVVKKLIELSDE